MNGSEKQINWASEIIEQNKSRLETIKSEANARFDGFQNLTPEQLEAEALFRDARVIACDLVIGALDDIDSAKFVIDNRGTLRRVIFDANLSKLSAADLDILKKLTTRFSSRNEFYQFILS